MKYRAVFFLCFFAIASLLLARVLDSRAMGVIGAVLGAAAFLYFMNCLARGLFTTSPANGENGGTDHDGVQS